MTTLFIHRYKNKLFRKKIFRLINEYEQADGRALWPGAHGQGDG